MGPIKRALISLIALALIGTYVSAQVPTGKIFGTITDEQGTPLPGVTVEATSPKLVGKGTAVSDEKGVYRIFALTPGLYKLAFTLQGFKTVTREGIIVELEQSVKLDVSMQLGALQYFCENLSPRFFGGLRLAKRGDDFKFFFGGKFFKP